MDALGCYGENAPCTHRFYTGVYYAAGRVYKGSLLQADSKSDKISEIQINKSQSTKLNWPKCCASGPWLSPDLGLHLLCLWNHLMPSAAPSEATKSKNQTSFGLKVTKKEAKKNKENKKNSAFTSFFASSVTFSCKWKRNVITISEGVKLSHESWFINHRHILRVMFLNHLIYFLISNFCLHIVSFISK